MSGVMARRALGALTNKWVQVGLVWAVIATALTLAALATGHAPEIRGDDAMRLVGAIDLFHGQNWFDTTQYRDNAPFGAPMHWSRLIDAPLVGLMALFTPFAHEAAPYWAAAVWPLLVLLAVVALLAELTERVAGPAARLPALALLAMAIAVYTEFMPGRVDHHNVQMALTLLMILASIEGRLHIGWAATAGIAAVTGIAIGTEILPSAAATLICFALYWLVDPKGSRRTVLGMALSFAAALLVYQVATIAPANWLVSACDALSATYVAAGIGYAAAMLIAVLLGSVLVHPVARLAVLAVLGVAVLAMLLWLFPECRYGPYGNLDADLAAILLPEIGEAQPIWIWASEFRAQLALLILPVLGMMATLVVPLLMPRGQRWRWVVLAGFCLALFAVFCLQVRGFRLLSVAILPAPAWLVAQVWSWFRARQSVSAAALAGLTIFSFSGAAHWSITNAAFAAVANKPRPAAEVNWMACLEPDAYDRLETLPRGNLMSFLLIGPQLLLETPHSVVSAGYHRNEAGLRDMVRFYIGGEAEAQAVVRERGLDYLVFCRGLPASLALAGVAEFTGLDWPWLEPLSDPEEALQIYGITPVQ